MHAATTATSPRHVASTQHMQLKVLYASAVVNSTTQVIVS
jgi:hypothetical protein